jgi:purine-binding chemotaxis protein CheW
MQEITKMPKTPDFVEGISNLRGEVLPIIDLRKRLGFSIKEADSETRIVVVNMDNNKIGMIVDAVSEVLTIQEETIEPTPAIVSTVSTQFITGIAKADERLIILLDLVKVLSTEEKEALQEIIQP